VLFLLLLLMVWLVVWSPLLSLRRLDVTGQERCTVAEIVNAAGIAPGDHLLLPVRWEPGLGPVTRLYDVRRSVERLPWIAEALVTWQMPRDVRIRVTEREPFARLPYLGGYLLVDAEGVVLQLQEGEPDPAVKELRGILFSGYANGYLPDMEEPERMEMGLRVLGALRNADPDAGPSLADAVRWVDVLAYDRVLISLEERVTVRLDPTGDLQYMLDFASEIFFRHIRPEESGMIDFTRGEDPSFIPD
jgi:cell division protein FtsQ